MAWIPPERPKTICVECVHYKGELRFGDLALVCDALDHQYSWSTVTGEKVMKRKLLCSTANAVGNCRHYEEK